MRPGCLPVIVRSVGAYRARLSSRRLALLHLVDGKLPALALAFGDGVQDGARAE